MQESRCVEVLKTWVDWLVRSVRPDLAGGLLLGSRGVGWCFAAEEPVPGSSVVDVSKLVLALLVGWCLEAEDPVPWSLVAEVGRLVSVWLVGWCSSTEKPDPGNSVEAQPGCASLMKGSVEWAAEAGGEWVGVTLTLAEVGSIVLANKRTSNLLNLSDHFWSSSAICESTFELLAIGLTALEVDRSRATVGGNFTVPCWSTAPKIATSDKSTSDSLSLEGVDSSFFASRFSFLILYQGVESCKRYSGEKASHIWQSESGFSTQGSLPFPLSLQCAQTRWLSKLAITWPQVPLLWPEDILIYRLYIICCYYKRQLNSQYLKIFHKFQSHKIIRVHIHKPNKKDAMTSRYLDTKEVRCATWQVHSTGTGRPVETQDVWRAGLRRPD